MAAYWKGLSDWLWRCPPELFYQQIMDERMQCLSYLVAAEPDEIDTGDRDRLTFVDAAGDGPAYPYQQKYLDDRRPGHTYTRFDSPEYQTAYFFCGYAFTALGRARDQTRQGPKPSFYSTLILGHFRQLYYRMGVAAHYQRAALLYFADEMSAAAKMLAGYDAASEAEHRQYRERMNTVQMEFLKFRSRSYFPEMTNQLQGQELNRMWHTHLGIKELFEQVDRTCDQINEVFTQRAAERLSRSQERLARVAAVFLPLSVALSGLSVAFAGDFLPKWFETGTDVPGRLWQITGGVMATTLAVSLVLWRWVRKPPTDRGE